MAAFCFCTMLIAFAVDSVAVAGQEVSQTELEHYNLLNQLRAEGFTCPEGKTFAPNSVPLNFDCRLWRASQLHSQEMAEQDYFSHTSQDGRSFVDRGRAQGMSPNAENIAAGSDSAQGVLDQFKSSDAHCINMLSPARKIFAVGYGFNSGSRFKHYWTQMFKNGNVDVDESCLSAAPTSSTTIITTTSEPPHTSITFTTSTTITITTTTAITGATLANRTTATTVTSTGEVAITTTTSTVTTATPVTSTDEVAITTTTSTMTTDIASTTFAALIQGSLSLNVSNTQNFFSNAFQRKEIKAALAGAVAFLAGVDINAVVVMSTEPRRLQSGIEAFSTVEAEYSITVPANEAALVLERIVSTELSLATTVVAQRLRDANFDGVVRVISFLANIVANDSNADEVRDDLTNPIKIVIVTGVCAVLLLLCCCCCCCLCCCASGRNDNSCLSALFNIEEGPNEEGAIVKYPNNAAEWANFFFKP